MSHATRIFESLLPTQSRGQVARVLVLVLLGLGWAAATDAFADQRNRGQSGQGSHMSREERERLREDMHSTRRNVYQEPQRRQQQLPPAGSRMSHEERERLRRDVEEANRGMRKR